MCLGLKQCPNLAIRSFHPTRPINLRILKVLSSRNSVNSQISNRHKIPSQLYELINEAKVGSKIVTEHCDYVLQNCERVKEDGTMEWKNNTQMLLIKQSMRQERMVLMFLVMTGYSQIGILALTMVQTSIQNFNINIDFNIDLIYSPGYSQCSSK